MILSRFSKGSGIQNTTRTFVFPLQTLCLQNRVTLRANIGREIPNHPAHQAVVLAGAREGVLQEGKAAP